MSNVDFSGYTKRIVRYLYDSYSNCDGVSAMPVWCLGQCYQIEERNDTETPAIGEASGTSIESTEAVGHEQLYDNTLAGLSSQPSIPISKYKSGYWPEAFLDDFESRIWLTYRSGFSPIARSHDASINWNLTLRVRLRNIANQGGFTSDTGFGCMIRSGQSLLANAILISKLGRDWRRSDSVNKEQPILSLFADDPEAPFSLHRFVRHGALACGKDPGEWFGPSATASCIQELNNNYSDSTLRVYVTGDGADVYEDRLMAIAKPEGSSFMCTLILIGTRLGINQITLSYHDALIALLKMPHSVGIAGGQPSASHYFVGCQGSNLLYLDPHLTRSALPLYSNMADYTIEEIDSCHCKHPKSLNVKEMDPSMLIGFLIKNEDDWQQWRQMISRSSGKAIIHVADRSPLVAGGSCERSEAIDEVESFDEDSDGDGGTILVEA